MANALQVVTGGNGAGNYLALAERAAETLAKSTIVPSDYRGNPANCLIAAEMAMRMNINPLAVMQNLYIVHGRPGWSSTFMISCFNTSGRFSALRYDWVGDAGKDTYGCMAWAVEKATGERLDGSTVTIALAKAEGWYGKNGSKWQTMPQQMLMYRAAAFFIRTYAPEIANGLHAADEIEDCADMGYDVEAEAPVSRSTKPRVTAAQVVIAEPTPTPAPEAKIAPPPVSQPAVTTPSRDVLTGILQDIETKNGNTNGKAWTRYGIKIDGSFYGTFDDALYDAASDLIGQPVEYTIEVNGKNKNLTSITAGSPVDVEA